MIKNKFYKNLYQSISFFSVILVFVFFLLLGFISTLGCENNGWILLLVAASLIILYFFVGFYWIFQMVEINDNGIIIKFFGKEIKAIHWEDVVNISYGNVMRNSSYTVVSKNGNKINLDSRKGIKELIKSYANVYGFIFNDKNE